MFSRAVPAATVAALALSLTSCAAHGSTTAPAPTSTPAPQIPGILPAAKPYPAEASLMLDRLDGRGPRAGCGATLIARVSGVSWMETAAHCMTETGKTTLEHGKYSLGIGSNDRAMQPSYTISRVVVHPGWHWTGRYDIALLAVAANLPETPAVIAAAAVGEHVTLTGWGRTTTDGSGEQATQLHQLDATVIGDAGCSVSTVPSIPPITQSELCIAGVQPGSGIGPGDSGSPAFDDAGHLIGSACRTVAAGTSQAGGTHAIYTRAADYLPWIAGVVLGIQPRLGMSPQQQVDEAARELAAAK